MSRTKSPKPKTNRDPRLDPEGEQFDPLAVAKEQGDGADQGPGPEQPARAAGRGDAEPELPKVAAKVFMHGFSSGPRGSLEAMPLHEIPLARRKLEAFGESLTLSTDWPEYVPRDRGITAPGLREEYNRLKEKYSFIGNDGQAYDLVTDIYGAPIQGRLVAVMRKQEKAWRALAKERDGKLTLEDWNTLVKIADPESDFIDTDIPATIEA